MRRLSTAAVGMVALAGLSAGAAAQIGVGSQAPEIEAKSWFNAPEAGTTMEELRGRVVFLEFWATW